MIKGRHIGTKMHNATSSLLNYHVTFNLPLARSLPQLSPLTRFISQ